MTRHEPQEIRLGRLQEFSAVSICGECLRKSLPSATNVNSAAREASLNYCRCTNLAATYPLSPRKSRLVLLDGITGAFTPQRRFAPRFALRNTGPIPSTGVFMLLDTNDVSLLLPRRRCRFGRVGTTATGDWPGVRMFRPNR